MDEQDAIGHRLDLLQDVRRDQDRLRLGQVADHLADALDLVGVEPARRFVEDQDLGVVQKCLRHRGPLAISLGKLADRLVGDGFERAALNDGVDPVGERLSRESAGRPEELEQSAGGHVGVERTVLGQVSQMLGRIDPIFLDVDAGDARRPFRGCDEPGQQAHRGRLAGAVGSEKGDDLALGNLEGHVAHRDEMPVLFAEPSSLDHHGRGHTFAYLGPRKNHLGDRPRKPPGTSFENRPTNRLEPSPRILSGGCGPPRRLIMRNRRRPCNPAP